MFNSPAKLHALGTAIAMAASMLAVDVATAQGIEEIVVTARKREENLQDVPMAIAAFGAEELRNSQVDNITDLQKMTPNITINETSGLVSGVVQIFIRGIGNDPSFDQGVGIYVDDVYLSTPVGALLEVYDIERIEVLKGPQGNLYGRNTIGGAIKYVSREPGNEPQGGAEAQVGSDELVKLKAHVSGALVEDLLFGGLALASTQRDGYQENAFDGSDWADSDVQALRGTVRWTPTDALALKLVADHSRDESRPGIPNRAAVDVDGIMEISSRLTGANGTYGPGTGIYDESSDTSLPRKVDTVNTAFTDGFDSYELETSSVAGTIGWDLNDALALKSVSAWREVQNPRGFDFDGSAQRFIDTTNAPENKAISQELQLNYSGDRLHAVLGAYYLDSRYSIGDPGVTQMTTRLRFFSDHRKTTWREDYDVESKSLYGNIEWGFAEGWQLSLGGRYTEDSADMEVGATVEELFYAFAGTMTPAGFDLLGIRPGQETFVENQPDFLFWFPNQLAQSLIDRGIPLTPGLPDATITRATTVRYEEPLAGDDTWNEFSPSAKLTHFLSDDTMAYAGFTSGFKAGGFGSTGDAVRSYAPEIVETWSLGIKTTRLDGMLRFNTELFFNDYQDKQFATIYLDASGSLIQTSDNVGKVESWGGEAELIWMTPVEGLVANLNLGYLDTEIKEFLQGDMSGVIDISDDRELGYTPEWSGQARLSYDFEFGTAGTMLLSGAVAYRDEMYTDSPIDTSSDFAKQAWSEAITTWDALVAFTTADQHWRLALEGRNLGDERELLNTYTVTNYMTGGYMRERTWAFSVGYTY